MKYFKTFLIIFSGSIIIYACSKTYLDKRPLGELDEAALANKKGVEGLLIGAYSLLDGNGSNKSFIGSAGSNWIYGSICGSEAYTGSFNGDGEVAFERFNSTANSESLASKWGTLYDGIQRANDVLRIMKKATDISEDDQKHVAGEARFLRAHYHFEAKKMWNKVPFIDETVTYEAANYHVPNDKDIWSDIENDLKYAVDNLSEDSYMGAVGRANKYTAMALLAKTYMFQKKFADASQVLTSIISSGKYQLNELYGDNFNPATKNKSESVFAAQSSVNDGAEGANGNLGDVFNFPAPSGGAPVPGGCCGFFQPSQYLVNHYKTDALTGLPNLDHYNDSDVTSDEGLESSDAFSPYTGTLDPRLDWTVGRRGIPYLDWSNHPGKDWIRDQGNGGPYLPKKNIYYKSQEGKYVDNGWSSLTANNINLIRYADVLLWAAEAAIEIGNPDQAEAYVNNIRNRAANPVGWVHTYIDPADPSKGFTTKPAANYKISPYPAGYFTSHGQDFALKAVRYERMLELAMEGQRFFDLVRWGIADTEINGYINKEKKLRTYLNGVVFDKNCDQYFAIPQLQIDLSAGADGVRQMKQNPCY